MFLESQACKQNKRHAFSHFWTELTWNDPMLISSQSSRDVIYNTFDTVAKCRSNNTSSWLSHTLYTCYLLSQPLAGRFISQVKVAEPIFATSLTNTLAVLRALSPCWSQQAHTPMSEHLRERESCADGCHIPTVSWKIPIRSNTSLLPLRERDEHVFVSYKVKCHENW